MNGHITSKTQPTMAMARLTSLRCGLATNSSASHSMIRGPSIATLEIPEVFDAAPYAFGEDDSMIADTPLRKRRYLACMLWDHHFELYADSDHGRWMTTELAHLYPKEWHEQILTTIMKLCAIPEQERELLKASEMGDLSGGAFLINSNIPRDPEGGPEREWLKWCLEQCDNPEVILIESGLAVSLGIAPWTD